MGQEFSELNPLAQSGVAELGNVITGQATVRFSEAGYQSSISTPTVLIGHGVEVSTLDFHRIVVPLETQFGDFTVHLALREKAPGTHHNPDELHPPVPLAAQRPDPATEQPGT
jgi:chemotaxis protein CheX